MPDWALPAWLRPQDLLSKDAFWSIAPRDLLVRMFVSHATYHGLAAALVTTLYHAAPKWYFKVHRYNELRRVLSLASVWPFLRHQVELLLDLGVAWLVHSRVGCLQATFPSPVHMVTFSRAAVPSMLFPLRYVTPELPMSRSFVSETVSILSMRGFATVFLAGGYELAWFLNYLRRLVTDTETENPGRALPHYGAWLASRVCCAVCVGAVASRVQSAAMRMLILYAWNIVVDGIVVRGLVVAPLLERFAPMTLEGHRYIPDDETVVSRFADDREERSARVLLMNLTAEQMQAAGAFSTQVLCAVHARASVKLEALRVMMYATLLSEGTTNEGVHLEDMDRVASVYQAEDDANGLETHGVDADHRTCAVCIGEFERSEQVATVRSCGHTFHVECVQRWWAQHSNCPVCRKQLLREQSSREGRTESSAAGQDDDDGNAQRDAERATRLSARLYRHFARCRIEPPTLEFGPFENVFYALGKRFGYNHVRMLAALRGDAEIASHSWDMVHMVLTLLFVAPSWN